MDVQQGWWMDNSLSGLFISVKFGCFPLVESAKPWIQYYSWVYQFPGISRTITNYEIKNSQYVYRYLRTFVYNINYMYELRQKIHEFIMFPATTKFGIHEFKSIHKKLFLWNCSLAPTIEKQTDMKRSAICQ